MAMKKQEMTLEELSQVNGGGIVSDFIDAVKKLFGAEEEKKPEVYPTTWINH